MQQNRMNVTLTSEQKATIIAAVEALESAIPFRLSLDNTERRRLLKLGSKSEGFVRQALEAARNHPEFVPAAISMEDLDRDEAAREVLLTLVQRVGALHTQLVDYRHGRRFRPDEGSDGDLPRLPGQWPG